MSVMFRHVEALQAFLDLCGCDLFDFGFTRFINLGMYSVYVVKNLHCHGLQQSLKAQYENF